LAGSTLAWTEMFLALLAGIVTVDGEMISVTAPVALSAGSRKVPFSLNTLSTVSLLRTDTVVLNERLVATSTVPKETALVSPAVVRATIVLFTARSTRTSPAPTRLIGVL